MKIQFTQFGCYESLWCISIKEGKYMAKLGILIAHYKEPLEQLKGMLDSINRQNIDFNQVKVCILNDGDDVVFQQSDFDGYNYSIECSIAERCGTSKMRNKLLGLSKDDFVWFLDSDDYLITILCKTYLMNYHQLKT